MRSTAFFALVACCLVPAARAAESPAAAERLRCEYRADPLGIDILQPRLSWEMNDARRGARQTAYQVLVASTPEKLAGQQGDLWDSGRVESDQSTQVVYAGKPLRSRMRCHWKVRLWDAEAFCRTATYDADMAAFFTKWLVDVEDAQRPDGEFPNVAPRGGNPTGGVAAWADAGVICPMTIYLAYGDKRLLEKHYGAMVRWVEYCRRNSTGLLRPKAGFGDWLSIEAETPLDVFGTAFFAHSTRLLADAARTLGKQDDARRYDELFAKIKEAFNRAYVGPDGRIKGNTQTCYALALCFDLLSEKDRQSATARLLADIKARGTHLSTGFHGTAALLPTLSANGNTSLAYKLLLSDTFPSWGYTIKHGATTTWERWDGWTAENGFQSPGMNSFSHYAFGAVGQWLFQTVAGIDTAEPGFQKLLIRPQPAPGLTWVKASYHSIHGPIATQWRIEGGKLLLTVTIPANTTATVIFPVHAWAEPITESGKPLGEAEGVKEISNRTSAVRIGAGRYEFVMPWAP